MLPIAGTITQRESRIRLVTLSSFAPPGSGIGVATGGTACSKNKYKAEGFESFLSADYEDRFRIST